MNNYTSKRADNIKKKFLIITMLSVMLVAAAIVFWYDYDVAPKKIVNDFIDLSYKTSYHGFGNYKIKGRDR